MAFNAGRRLTERRRRRSADSHSCSRPIVYTATSRFYRPPVSVGRLCSCRHAGSRESQSAERLSYADSHSRSRPIEYTATSRFCRPPVSVGRLCSCRHAASRESQSAERLSYGFSSQLREAPTSGQSHACFNSLSFAAHSDHFPFENIRARS